MNDSISLKLHTLVIFRNILKDNVISSLLSLSDASSGDKVALADAYSAFAASVYEAGGNFSQHLLKLVLEDENVYTDSIIKGCGDASLLGAQLKNELTSLSEIALFDGSEYASALPGTALAHWNTEKIDFASVYTERMKNISKTGVGIFSKYNVFLLDETGALVPVKNPDTQSLEDLYGYEAEKKKVIANTIALIEGRPANNVLLYGDAGTGKSSTVKAVANRYADSGLRLIEVKKNRLHLLPSLLDELSENPLKFILFIDDLTFASDDKDFTALKAILEGGVNSRGSNVLIYATTNHRHLVRETSSDRVGDEISIGDKLQETLSLSARFGLIITFLRPDKELYTDIVCRLADKAGIVMDRDTLITMAEAHAIRSGGRNPRTAKQFIDLLSSEVL